MRKKKCIHLWVVRPAGKKEQKVICQRCGKFDSYIKIKYTSQHD